jgi:DNA-binding CsgD family transcriptional regulator
VREAVLDHGRDPAALLQPGPRCLPVSALEQRRPGLVRESQAALDSGDVLELLMARALEWVAAQVPTALSVFYPVDQRLRKFHSGPIVIKLDGRLRIDLPFAVGEYARLYHALDPFAPRRFADCGKSVVGVSELGGAGVFSQTRYSREYLAAFGLGTATGVFLRDHGRIIAGVSLLREVGQPEPSAGEISVLRRLHPFLEASYAAANRVTSTGAGFGTALAAAGLTRREAEIARLVAAGATNGDIARALVLSLSTVKGHVKHVFAKLGVRSRAQLILLIDAEERALAQSSPRPDRLAVSLSLAAGEL